MPLVLRVTSMIKDVYIFKRYPHVRMAVTEDHDWISVIKEVEYIHKLQDDFIFPPGDEIYKRIMESFTVRVEKGFVVFKNYLLQDR